ncbi:MAG TPA: hypothetical protein VIL76_16005 [Phenylobacterium sp.]
MSAVSRGDKRAPAPDFETVRTLAADLGLALREAEYNHRAFGSWYLTVAAGHRELRIVYDGRDFQLRIDEPVTPVGNWEPWAECWAAESESVGQLAALNRELVGRLSLDP